MPDSTLDQLAKVQARLTGLEAKRQQLIAQRDELLRRSWAERITQATIAQRLGLSMQRTGNLRRRARETT
jgi:hypothetical protein